MRLAYGILLAVLVAAPVAHAEEKPIKLLSADSEAECTSRWNASENGNVSNAIFIRKCIRNVRNQLAAEREAQWRSIRQDERDKREAATAEVIRKNSREHFTNSVQNRYYYLSTRRESPRSPSVRNMFYEERQSRRLLIQEKEGQDSITALRRKLMSEDRGDPCTSVGAISKYNNPCRNYDSFIRSGVLSPYLEYLK